MKFEHFMIKVVAGTMAVAAIACEINRPADFSAAKPVVFIKQPADRQDLLVLRSLWKSGVMPTPPRPAAKLPAAKIEEPKVAVHKVAVPKVAVHKVAPHKVASAHKQPRKLVAHKPVQKTIQRVAMTTPVESRTQPKRLSIKQKIGKMWIGLKSKFKRKQPEM